MQESVLSDRIAIVSPLHIKPEHLVERLSPFAEEQCIKEALHLSNGGPHFDISGDHPAAASMFALLDSSFRQVFIVGEFPITYAHNMTLWWLAGLLSSIGEGGELFVEILNEKANRQKNLITQDFLEKNLDGADISRVQSNWLRISAGEGLNLQEHPSILEKIRSNFDEFVAVRNSTAMVTPTQRADALRSFIYSVFGTSQKVYLVDRIIEDCGLEGGPGARGIDLGAGYGFMAAELALKGMSMHAVDYNPAHVKVGNWLAEQCSITDRFTMEEGSMEAVAEIEGEYNIVSFFGCLLYADRKMVPEILQSSMKLLKKGGVLIIHENSMEGGEPGSQDYELRFKADELLALIQENAGTPQFYNAFSGKTVGWDTIKHRLIVAAVKKN